LLCEFLRNRELVIHNSAFDLGWLKAKFGFPYPQMPRTVRPSRMNGERK
jgi:DNA polymerase III epsilon subunit-like protein